MKTNKDYYDTQFGIVLAALEVLKDILLSFLMVALVIAFVGLLCKIGNPEKAEADVAFYEAPTMPQEIKIDEPQTKDQVTDPYLLTILNVEDVCDIYDLDPCFIKSIIWHESRFDPNAKSSNGKCIGLMQINEYWHKDRMERLGVSNLQDSYSNILVGCDYISELFDKYQDPHLVLMLYNMPHDKAMQKFKQGEISYYAKSVMSLTKHLKEGGSFDIS